MSTSISQPQTNQQPAGVAKAAKPSPNARRKGSKKATPAKQRGKARKPAKAGARPASKTAKILQLLQRSGGATLKQLIEATHWQAHSVRGFLSGTLRKKMGLSVVCSKSQDGHSSYVVKG